MGFVTILEHKPTTVPAALNAAADYIDTHGWMQGVKAYNAVFHPGLPTCASVAVQVVVGGEEWSTSPTCYDTFAALSAHLDVAYDFRQPALGIVRWNDEEDRTKDEVVAALREAAASARAEQ